MELGREVAIMDPYAWLPTYGETTVNFQTKDGNLSAVVEYDGSHNLARKELLFYGVCSFQQGSFPGPTFLRFIQSIKNAPSQLGSLIEYPDSEAAKAWTQHFGDGRIIKHYHMLFLSANEGLTVFAHDWALREIN